MNIIIIHSIIQSIERYIITLHSTVSTYHLRGLILQRTKKEHAQRRQEKDGVQGCRNNRGRRRRRRHYSRS
jgi:hypothetical protein